eukprot:scaffold29262_cov33-Prasinocladus_malaysianus.AAC.1
MPSNGGCICRWVNQARTSGECPLSMYISRCAVVPYSQNYYTDRMPLLGKRKANGGVSGQNRIGQECARPGWTS